MDDTFLLFSSPNHVPLFLYYFNSRRPNIQFMSETEEQNKIPILDVHVTKKNNFLPLQSTVNLNSQTLLQSSILQSLYSISEIW